jgi:hypothetical protein
LTPLRPAASSYFLPAVIATAYDYFAVTARRNPHGRTTYEPNRQAVEAEAEADRARAGRNNRVPALRAAPDLPAIAGDAPRNALEAFAYAIDLAEACDSPDELRAFTDDLVEARRRTWGERPWSGAAKDPLRALAHLADMFNGFVE